MRPGGNSPNSVLRNRSIDNRRRHPYIEGMTDTPETKIPEPATDEKKSPPAEIGGPKEADPTRYGDWTVKGRCIDF